MKDIKITVLKLLMPLVFLLFVFTPSAQAQTYTSSIRYHSMGMHTSTSHDMHPSMMRRIGRYDQGNISERLRNIRVFHAIMTGNQEVPGPGDPDSIGISIFLIDSNSNVICVIERVRNIEPANAAHIHRGSVGVAGPIVVSLPVPDVNGFASGCLSADRNLIQDIVNNPSQYYANVHNPRYPDGALRGQLSY